MIDIAEAENLGYYRSVGRELAARLQPWAPVTLTWQRSQAKRGPGASRGRGVRRARGQSPGHAGPDPGHRRRRRGQPTSSSGPPVRPLRPADPPSRLLPLTVGDLASAAARAPDSARRCGHGDRGGPQAPRRRPATPATRSSCTGRWPSSLTVRTRRRSSSWRSAHPGAELWPLRAGARPARVRQRVAPAAPYRPRTWPTCRRRS